MDTDYIAVGEVIDDGNPGVVIFYEVAGSDGVLRVERSGSDVVLSGW